MSSQKTPFMSRSVFSVTVAPGRERLPGRPQRMGKTKRGCDGPGPAGSGEGSDYATAAGACSDINTSASIATTGGRRIAGTRSPAAGDFPVRRQKRGGHHASYRNHHDTPMAFHIEAQGRRAAAHPGLRVRIAAACADGVPHRATCVTPSA